MVIAMTIVCLSLSHRLVPAELLEKLAVPAGELGEVLGRLHAAPGVDEAVVLSTCNRVEVYAAVSGPAEPVTGAMADLLAARGHVPADEVTRMARIRLGRGAAEHLFAVACGLDSMALVRTRSSPRSRPPAARPPPPAPPARPSPASSTRRWRPANGPARRPRSAPRASRWPGPA
jgi:glutamyl-tRNA reductase